MGFVARMPGTRRSLCDRCREGGAASRDAGHQDLKVRNCGRGATRDQRIPRVRHEEVRGCAIEAGVFILANIKSPAARV
jgi:hypothetical protein